MTGRPVSRSAPPTALPPLYGDLEGWGLIHADALEMLQRFPADSVDALVCDPPFGLAFNNQPWDGGTLATGEGFQSFTRWWAEHALRVMRPGAWGAVHGAPRTIHRLVSGLEDAGFEVRDQTAWVFGSGVPKGRLVRGLSSTLKPAWEPIALIRKPLDRAARTLAEHVQQHGTGALNINQARIPRASSEPNRVGYWPANLALSHELDCEPNRGECVPDCPLPLMDRLAATEQVPTDRRFSRLFSATKASRVEREAGLEHLPKRTAPVFSGSGTSPRANHHPTVKPLELTRWLIKLVVPPGGVVLDPFTGSGTTGCAAVLEGRRFIGIEREDYIEIARARIAHWAKVAREGRS